MKFIRKFRFSKYVFIFIFLSICISYLWLFIVTPENITFIEGEEYTLDFEKNLLLSIEKKDNDILKFLDTGVSGWNNIFRVSAPVMFKTQKKGSTKVNLKFMGIVPLKSVNINIIPDREVVACGNTIGVKIKTQGILVIGISSVEIEDNKSIIPAKTSGIKPGDFICEVNNNVMNNVDELINEIYKSKGNPLKVKYTNGSYQHETYITPQKSINDKKYHIGLWVRDSAAGIGTLTFFEPETGYFGALGHGITDIDTEILLPINEGEILKSNIITVKKGEAGTPGELKGVFVETRNRLGIIEKNCDYGIYGIINNKFLNNSEMKICSIGLRNEIKEGSAYIFANISGNTVKKYSIEIEKVFRNNYKDTRGMVIKITDEELIKETGGIVQGMSGCPIIQNNKIVGAITHVIVNNPVKGYGIFIESMINNIESSYNKVYKDVG